MDKLMGKTGAGANSQADRKRNEQRRLADALRANLNRRKAQTRQRRMLDPAPQDAAPDAG